MRISAVRHPRLLLLPVFLCFIQLPSFAKTWQVGPTRTYTKPSQVMSLVADGDTVLIDSGLYVKDVGVWRAKHLVLRCPNGYAHLDAQGTAAARKGIWVIDGDSAYVEGIEFSGCAISEADGSNGAGIRFESHNLECRHCFFHDNQEGILTGNDTTNEIVIEACEFDHNGVETGAAAGFQHNIYVGHSRMCRIAFCNFHRSIVGHEVKSRANRSFILYNYIVDGPDGDGSYSIDLPNGGLGDVVGNIIEKGPKTQNSTIVTYGEEGFVNPDKRFYFAWNTVVTDRQPAIFLHIADGTETAVVANNIFAGGTHLLVGTADTINNLMKADTAYFHFRDPKSYDYHITAPFVGSDSVSPALTVDPTVILWPNSEYVHPLDSARAFTHLPTYIGALAPTYNAAVRYMDPAAISLSYPNPFSTVAYIRLPSEVTATEATVHLFNTVGAEVRSLSCPITDHTLRIDRGTLGDGAYRYEVSVGSRGIATGSIVVR